jgi:hypothetical protein
MINRQSRTPTEAAHQLSHRNRGRSMGICQIVLVAADVAASGDELGNKIDN